MPQAASFASVRRWRATTLLRLVSFLSLWAAAFASLAASAGWSVLHAAFAASALTGSLGLGALYSPLLAGITARTSGADGRLVARPSRGASWTGGAVGMLAMGAGLALVARAAGGAGAAPALLPAMALGLNAAYLPAKAACLLQGCCRARADRAPQWLARFPGQIPGVELALTLATLLACWLAREAQMGAWAAIGFLGHGATRLASITARGHALTPWLRDPGLELPILAALALLSLILA